MKRAFMFRGLYQSFEQQFCPMPNQTFPNINLHSFLPQNRQPNVTQLRNTGPDPAAL